MLKKTLLLILSIFILTFIYSESFSSLKKKAINLVDRSLSYLKINGKEKTFDKINDPKGEFVDGEFYLFVFDFNGVCLAHGGNNKLIGKNHLGLKDSNGKYFIKEMLDVAKSKSSGWIYYKWSNPLKKKIQSKITYVKKIENMDAFIACGFYK